MTITRILLLDGLIYLAGATLLMFLVYRLALVAPLRRLSQAAWRIGRGDLHSPILEKAGGGEIARLADSLEEMRQRLLETGATSRQREAEAEALLAGMAEGVFAVDRERRLTYLNPQAAALLGLAPDEAIGLFCGDVLQPRLPTGGRPCENQCPIVNARSGGGARATEHLAPAGSPPHTVVLRSAAPAGGRQVVLMREEQEAETGLRLRDSFFAHVSHELKTPLAGQLASIELLLDSWEELSPESARRLIESLQRSALRLERLIGNLLESVRLEKSPFDLPRELLDLRPVIAEAAEALEPLLAQKGQSLTLHLPEKLPAIPGAPGSLAQVFVNLLANAHKYAPAGSPIEIGARELDAFLEVWVEDRGPGLPADTAGSIFDLFTRGPAPGVTQNGLGLGLFIVKAIVERHGGRVFAEAAEPHGARIRLTLPKAEEGVSP